MAYELQNTATGDVERIDESGMQDALASGRYAIRQDAVLPMDDGQGNIRMVPGSQAGDAVKAGYTFAPQSKVAAYDERKAYDSAAGAIGAFTAATASGATLGASDWLLSKTPLKEDIAKAYEYNPGAKMAGEVTGFAGSMLLPGAQVGAVVKGGKAAKALAAAPKLTNAAANMAEKAMLAAVEKAAIPGLSKALQSKVMQGALSTGARGAVEGAIYDAGRILSESSIEDKEFTAEQVLGRLGMSAALGGAGGAAMNTLGLGALSAGKLGIKGAKAAAGAVADAVESKTGRKVSGWIKDQLEDKFIQGSAFVRGESPEKIRRAMKAAKDLENEDAIMQDAVKEGREIMDRAFFGSKEVTEESMGKLKPKHVAEGLSKPVEGVAPRDSLRAYDDSLNVVNEIKGTIAKMTSPELKSDYGFQAALKRIDDVATKVLKRAKRGGTLEDDAQLYMLQNSLKQEMGRITYKPRGMLSEAAQETLDVLDGVYDGLKLHLEDTALWGQAGIMQKNINAAWTKDLALKYGRYEKFGTKVREFKGKPIYEADPSKLGSFFKRSHLGEEVRKEHELLAESIANRQELLKTIRENYDIGDKSDFVEQFIRDTDRLIALKDHIAGKLTEINIAKEVMQKTSAVDAFSGSGVGAGLFGVSGAAVGGLLGALQKPIQTMQQVGAIMGLAKQGKDLAAKAVKGFVAKAEQPVIRATSAAGKQVRRATAISAITSLRYEPGRKSYESRAEAYNARLDELSKLATDPMALAARVESITKPWAANAPETAAQVGNTMRRATTFLFNKAPKPPGGLDPLRPKKRWQPSDMELAKFARYQQAVENPQSVVDSLQDGNVSREGVEALKEVYPATYAQLQRHLVENLADIRGDLNYDARRQLSVVFGVPIENTMKPGFIQTMQAQFAAQEQQKPQSSAKPMKLESWGQDMETQAQRVARGV